MNPKTKRDQYFLPTLIAIFVLVLIALVISLVITYREAEDVAHTVLLKTAKNVSHDISGYLEPAQLGNAYFSDYLSIHGFDLENTKALEDMAMDFMKRYPSLQSLNIGFESGDFFMVKHEGDTSFSTKKMYRSSSQPYMTWTYRDTQDRIKETLTLDIDDYDPRLRPWYTGAMNKQGLFWSEIYTFFTSQNPGVTVGQPLKNSDKGVLSFDIEVSQIADYVANLSVSENGEAIIVNYKKDMLVFKTAQSTTYSNALTSPIAVSEFNNPVIAASYARSGLATNEVASFTVDNAAYYLVYTDLIDLERSNWKVGIIIPEDDFLSGFKATAVISLVAIVAIGVLIILLNYYRYSEKRIKDQLIKRADRDTLTQLLNRRSIHKVYDALMKDNGKLGLPVGMILCDLDHFKKINDIYGHNAGDHVLKEVASLMQANLRTGDYLCRWGGEEFLILIKKSNPDQLMIVAEKLRKLIEEEALVYDSTAMYVTMSFGVALIEDNLDLELAIKKADQLLYKAKENGRNRVEI